MRDFNFQDANISAANIAGVQPIPQELPLTPSDDLRRDEMIEDGATLNSFHRSEEDDASNNTAKIAGAVLVGLLIVGGGIYAYESTLKNGTAPQAVAMKTPAPSTVAAATPDTTAPDTNTATQPAPTPSTATTPSVPARQTVRTARDTSNTSAASSTADTAANQPMTLTPQTAPPAQQAASSQTAPSQTAQVQQPITAPLGQPTVLPQPEVANNASSGVTLPSDNTTANAPAAAPSDAQPDMSSQPAAPAQPASGQ